LRSLLFCVMLSATALSAANIVTVTGPFNFNNNGTSYVSWTQTAAYSGVSIAATFVNGSPSAPGAAASGNVYLTTQTGAGTTVAQQIATAPVSSTATGGGGTSMTLFTGLTLNAGTYFLVMSPTVAFGANSMAWSFGSPVTVTTAAGVTANTSFSASAVAAYPPASTFTNTKGQGMMYSVLGTLGVGPGASPQGVPTLSGWGMLALALALGLSGIWLVRKYENA
jgi:hypothetical protein